MNARLACLSLAVVLLLNAASLALHAAPEKAHRSQLSSLTKAGSSIPESVFVLPTNSREGRDPFFPDSTRPYRGTAPAKPATPSTDITLVWNGVSGTGDKRLVMINGQTFGQGDSHTFITGRGRVQVRCIETQDDSVVVEVNGQRRVLQRPAF